jgi:lipopolysaccharide/colanic/teichoic acid biosynthesis glycosyltransferase/nucleotide-binding universal stress UspA family protein
MRPPYGRHVSLLETMTGAHWPRVPAQWRLRRWLAGRRDVLVAPVCGAIALGALVQPADGLRYGLLGFSVLAAGACVTRRVAPQAALLPLMRHVYRFIGPALGLLLLALIELLAKTPAADPLDLMIALVVTGLAAEPWAGLGGTPALGGARAAYIGSPEAAQRLARALASVGSRQYVLVGCVTDHGADGARRLGELGELARIVVEHDIDLLVMGSDAPRLKVFGEVTETCLGLPVRLVELSSLFEEVFGHVPTAEINAAWFQCLAHLHTRASSPLKRTIDVAGALLTLAVALPLLPVLVLLIRRDGGPALFDQVRIGEGGHRFLLHKLRTMRVDADSSAQWACPDDPRITRVGAWLRRTHLDELPQLVNVLRGEMSLVGPRPEQPEFVDRLERMLPFYQRRHLMRPGITGWAQVRCGYAGSDVGSAWKLCHDLYYAKHRSTGVDLLILGETLATLAFEREPVMRPENVAFVLADER